MPHRTTPLVQSKVCWRMSHHSVTPTTHSSRTPVKMENLDDKDRYFRGRDFSTLSCSDGLSC